MFKRITPYPWSVSNTTVWGYENEYGTPQVASMNKSVPVSTQRANARLISIAPQMFEVLMTLTDNDEAMALVRYMNKEQS
jgi:hypothetical protein